MSFITSIVPSLWDSENEEKETDPSNSETRVAIILRQSVDENDRVLVDILDVSCCCDGCSITQIVDVLRVKFIEDQSHSLVGDFAECFEIFSVHDLTYTDIFRDLSAR